MTEYGTVVMYRLKEQQLVETKTFWGENHGQEALTFLNSVFPNTNYHVYQPTSREVE